MSDEVFYSNGFLRDLARKRMKQVEAEKKAQEKAQAKTARMLEKEAKAREKTAQQEWDALPAPATNPDWDYPAHGGDILKELVGAVEGYVANGGELPAFLCLDENGRFWLSSDVGSGGSLYQGYFALSFDEEAPSVFNVRGGIALVNGWAASVADHQFGWPGVSGSGSNSGSGSGSGEWHLWLYAYVRATDSQDRPFDVGAELVFCSADKDDDASTHPAATNIIQSSRKLIASVWGPQSGSNRGTWRQEFITGSECNFILLGDACE